MSVAVTFDTHKFIKQMVATGFTEEQAEIQVRMLSEILDTQLSTKADMAKLDANMLELKRDIREIDAKVELTKAVLQKEIEAVRLGLQKEIEAVRLGLQKEIEAVRTGMQKDLESTRLELQRDIISVKKDIESAKLDTIKWTAGMFAAQTALIIGVLFTFTIKTGTPSLPPPPYQPSQEMRLPSPTP
ncbi:MAG: DUF1640 domain-containing protein [Magnetococcales bacterium]|nr:DUF1640 domain-containing protein [Magnetococcales bacterium]